jgi:ADP-dependent phosphofructokinase/glucokinase
METNLKNEIDFEIRKNLTDGICVSGANISNMKHLLKKKYVSKKEMKKALETQMEYLKMIEKSKNELLIKLNCA